VTPPRLKAEWCLGMAILTDLIAVPFWGSWAARSRETPHVFHADDSCIPEFDMTLTVRVSSYFTIPLYANLLSVSSAFITCTTSLFINVELFMSVGSWNSSSSFELSTIRTQMVGRPPRLSISLRLNSIQRGNSRYVVSER
jgi:hypothetical protein